jgi:ABC-type antimicrobial peptide transport system permease subunit
MHLVVRGGRSLAELTSATRAAIQPINPSMPVNEIRVVQEIVDRSVSPRRFIVTLLMGFAGFALILASLGIYGVISYSVNQRRREIGIRMALGATAGRLQRSILAHTLKLVAAGAALGASAFWAIRRVIQSLLFEVTTADPVTFAVVLTILAAVATLAGYLPARKASRIDPATALRAE